MNILMISLDKKIFQSNSAVCQRMIKYGGLCDKLAIVVLTRKGYEETQLDDNVRAYPTNSWNKFFYIFNAYKLAKKILAAGGQWLVTTQDPFETALVGWVIKKKFVIPLQIQIHTDFLSPYFWRESFWNKKRVKLAEWLVPRADKLRVVSERIKKSMESKWKSASWRIKAKISVAPVYIDVQKIIASQPKFDLHQKYRFFDFIILSLGRLSKEKNISLLLKSFKEIIKKYPKTLLIISGDGPERKNLEFRIKNLELNNNVVMEGWTADAISFYKTADLFVLCSNYEGYGMAVIEAMAAGCPVIMTDVGCAGEIVKNNENGLVAPINDKKALTEAMIKMIESPTLREQFKRRGKETVEDLPKEDEILSKIFI